MANQLDLEEQEQLDQLKHFWSQYGNAITWVLIAVLSAVAAWNGYQYWNRNQAVQAAAMFDEVERVVRSGDVEKSNRAFDDMKDRFGSAAYTGQAGLLVAKLASDKGNTDIAIAVLGWLTDHAQDEGYADTAKLRLASLYLDSKAYDKALTALNGVKSAAFAPLLADRKGDVLMLQGKPGEAKAEYLVAYKAFDQRADYRRLVLVKLNALGVNPESTN